MARMRKRVGEIGPSDFAKYRVWRYNTLLAHAYRPGELAGNCMSSHTRSAIQWARTHVRRDRTPAFCLTATNGVEWMDVFAPAPLAEKLFKIAARRCSIAPSDYHLYDDWLPEKYLPPGLREG